MTAVLPAQKTQHTNRGKLPGLLTVMCVLLGIVSGMEVYAPPRITMRSGASRRAASCSVVG